MRPSIFVINLAERAVGVGVCGCGQFFFSMIAHVLDELEPEELCDLNNKVICKVHDIN